MDPTNAAAQRTAESYQKQRHGDFITYAAEQADILGFFGPQRDHFLVATGVMRGSIEFGAEFKRRIEAKK